MASEIAKQNIVFALCKYLSMDPNEFSSDLGSDVKSLYTRMLSSSGNGDVQFNNIKNLLLENSIVTLESLGKLNEELLTKSVLLGGGLKPSEADIIVFSVVHATVSDLSSSDNGLILFRHDGRPGDVLNPKKKQWDKITPHLLFTDDNGVATFKKIPFTTSAGPCTSSIPIASIK